MDRLNQLSAIGLEQAAKILQDKGEAACLAYLGEYCSQITWTTEYVGLLAYALRTGAAWLTSGYTLNRSNGQTLTCATTATVVCL
jgi:hypothetical protein